MVHVEHDDVDGVRPRFGLGSAVLDSEVFEFSAHSFGTPCSVSEMM